MKSRRILIVDDSRVEREVLARVISGWGFQPDMAANGVEALAAIETGPVDLLLLDFLMPLLNGLEIIDQVRKMQNCRDLPIIVVSGASPARQQECYAAGADCYLSKPVQTGELRQAIELLLNRLRQPTIGCPGLASTETRKSMTDGITNTDSRSPGAGGP